RSRTDGAGLGQPHPQRNRGHDVRRPAHDLGDPPRAGGVDRRAGYWTRSPCGEASGDLPAVLYDEAPGDRPGAVDLATDRHAARWHVAGRGYAWGRSDIRRRPAPRGREGDGPWSRMRVACWW